MIDDGGRISLRRVKVGLNNKVGCPDLSGLSTGERVIVSEVNAGQSNAAGACRPHGDVTMGALLQLRGIRRHFKEGECTVTRADGIELATPWEMVAIVGASGSGKSTLMNLLGCLDQPSEGPHLVAGRDTPPSAGTSSPPCAGEHLAAFSSVITCWRISMPAPHVEVPALYAGLDPAER